jgi:anti-sigma factor RsiW
MHNRTHPDTESLDRLRAGLLDESSDERDALRNHLAECPQCQDYMDGWRQLGPDALGPELDTSAVAAGLQQARRHALGAGKPRHVGTYSALAAAAMLLLAVTAGLWTWQPGLHESPQMTAQTGDPVPDLYEDLDFYLWMANQHENDAEEHGNANRT